MNSRAQSVDAAGELARLRLELRGVVQGVGFRPHVYRTARTLGLSGWVRNDGRGVTLEVEGARTQEFADILQATLPPLARIDVLRSIRVPLRGSQGFRIESSSTAGGVSAAVPADAGLCDGCLHELFDPSDRRYLHPFIACCDCGPRYTMARHLPYDRDTTSMGDFSLCPDCADEYGDPRSRRFHAEPIACHSCGPRLTTTVADMAAAISRGEIVALKGIGGYHLVCDATRADAVETLRRRKRRDARPFAVMMLNAASAATQVDCSAHAARALQSPQRPVVILDRSANYTLPEALAPDIGTLGVILPYTAVHYLLFHALLGRPGGDSWLREPCDVALVMTSANVSGEPMLCDDGAAAAALSSIADLQVSHNRTVTHGCDDSVLRVSGTGSTLIRRSRGHAPGAIALPRSAAPVLALGAHLKNTVCAVRDDQAFLSAHIGDLESPAMHRLLRHSAGELLDWLQLEPAALACDLHPDYASSRLAQQLADALNVPLIPVQHHHAHIAAVAAAEGHDGPLLGLALDGHGLGTDGSSWGGELLLLDDAQSRRLGHLRPLALPGGDRAAREPWRLAMGIAAELGRERELRDRLGHPPLAAAVAQLASSRSCPSTTAAGRYFDGAAALLGICSHAAYEAAAPMRLEAHCSELTSDSGLYRVDDGVLDLHALFDRLIDAQDPAAGSALFHGTLVDALSAWVCRAAESSGIRSIALGGGCFHNAVLGTALPARLRSAGLAVLTGWDRVPPGDGGISLGQAWVAAQRLRAPARGGCESREERY